MNRLLSILALWLALLLYVGQASAQKHYPDEWWPVGTHEYPDEPGYGNAWVHFENGQPTVVPADLKMNFEAAVAVAVDSLGHVLFYSNGCEIRGADGEVLENGTGLNPGALHDWVCGVVGYTLPRSMTALPLPEHPSRWVLLHLGGEYDPVRKTIYGPLYLSEIDMAANGGRGTVTRKNVVVALGELEPFAIVRHANGRDWWVVLPQRGTNRYQIRLLSPQGLSHPTVQAIGPILNCRRVGASTFSPDGAKYALTDNCMVVVMDFDRCAGVFSNPITLPRDKGMLGGGGLAFSSDNRWLYATTDLCIFRADLTASKPFLDSLYKRPYLLYVDEPPVSEYVYGTSLTYMQLAPDGRIYMAARHRERYFPRFTIWGDEYAFEPKGLPLPVPTVRTLPHFPNFRLYDVDKSPCDTLGIDGTSSTTGPPADAFTVRFLPNPFHEHLTIQATEGGQLRIWRTDGTLVLSQVLQAGEQRLSTAHWDDGVYVWQVFSASEKIMAGRIVKVRR